MRSAITLRPGEVIALQRSACYLLVCATLVLASCLNIPSLQQRLERAQSVASLRHWQLSRIDAGDFELASWGDAGVAASQALSIYIEGDGLAFIAADRISDDPTPLQPLALELAMAQSSGIAVYLARPCQYTGITSNCNSALWGRARYAPKVVDSINRAISSLKVAHGARQLTLVGYSGGGALAALIAERRDDVVRLVTVAGNLSTTAQSEQLGLSPLTGSLDPLAQRVRLEQLEQWHFAGSKDAVVPNHLTASFIVGMPHAHLEIIDGFDHTCCWVERWPELWRQLTSVR